jgi:hypothetical protein
VNWNTAPLANGPYDVQAVITDKVGNSTTSVVPVTVANVYTFTVFSPGAQTAGTAFPSTSKTISLRENGSAATTFNGVAYTGTKAITFSGPDAAPDGTSPTYPATISFTNGVGTVPAGSMTVVDAGTGVSLTATDTANGITGTSATFTVNAGAAAGLIWTNASTKSGAATVTCSGAVGSASFVCAISPDNGSGNGRFFTANASLIDAYQNIAKNSSTGAISVAITTSNGSVTGSPVSIAKNASQSGTAFTVNLPNGSGSALVTATATVGGSSVSVQSTVG